MSQKVSTLQTLNQSSGEDLLLIVDDPNGTPTSKKISVSNFVGNLTSNVATTGTMSANGISTTASVIVTSPVTVTSSAVNLPVGTITWDQNYIYVTVANGVTKRAALNSF